MCAAAAPSSLVKYETPILLSDAQHKTLQAKRAAGGAKNGKHQQPQSEDVLFSILPPREFEKEGQRWVQYPSSTPATRLDVIHLQEELDTLLVERQARETGVCPIREELYGQVFDELIRQVTISCAERGLLLLRVRDEIRMTLDAYRSLYESSIAFGMRKALHAEQSHVELEARVRALEREKADLQRQVEELEEECTEIEKKDELRRKEEEKKHEEEVAFFRRTYQTLTANLQTVVNPTKA
ncbi:putative dynein arm light chain [Leptomonas seymouri]|uniref:Putative dynein arm light chain n=1 Tax=Leptomonas seymouri TaxID=5684 RepID=A0A0N1PBX9_LEPSE|nr:putative dynein arm light chain [Leptomonas seymouri]|eukprot:KPI86420.1 putative dynein arm light chain [Leptomonas seymouri]